MDATSLATLWATVALLIFIGIVLYIKVPAMLSKALDARADRIRGELDDARRLREEAQTLLADYQKKRKEAEQKIGQAEREAIAEVRASAVDLAVEAARQVLAAKADARTGAELFKTALQEVKAKLN